MFLDNLRVHHTKKSAELDERTLISFYIQYTIQSRVQFNRAFLELSKTQIQEIKAREPISR
jgi:hypothetical protein